MKKDSALNTDTLIYDFKAPNGYIVVTRTFEMETGAAKSYLASKARKKVATVNHTYNDKVCITSPIFICPHCGNTLLPFKRVADNKEIQTFLTQNSFFDTLEINRLTDYPHRCKHCDHALYPSTKAARVRITANKSEELVVFAVYLDFGEWSETTFDIKNGRILFKNNYGNFPIILQDCSCNLEDWKCCESYRALDEYYLVRRKLHHAFLFILDELPFTAINFTPVNAVLTTLFRGYNKQFYEEIPVTADGFDESFKENIPQLHDADHVAAYYNGLPDNDVVRSIVLDRCPWMLFYKGEIVFLSELLQSEELLTKLLKWERVHQFLDFMKKYRIREYLIDFVSETSPKKLVDFMMVNFDAFLSSSVKYIALTDSGRAKARKRWKNGVFLEKFSGETLHNKDLPKYSVVDGHEFIKGEFEDHSQAELHLEMKLDFTSRFSEKYLIKRYGQFVGFVETAQNAILLTSRARGNASITTNTALLLAVQKWRNRFLMVDIRCEDDDEEESEFYDEDEEFE